MYTKGSRIFETRARVRYGHAIIYRSFIFVRRQRAIFSSQLQRSSITKGSRTFLLSSLREASLHFHLHINVRPISGGVIMRPHSDLNSPFVLANERYLYPRITSPSVLSVSTFSAPRKTSTLSPSIGAREWGSKRKTETSWKNRITTKKKERNN